MFDHRSVTKNTDTINILRRAFIEADEEDIFFPRLVQANDTKMKNAATTVPAIDGSCEAS